MIIENLLFLRRFFFVEFENYSEGFSILSIQWLSQQLADENNTICSIYLKMTGVQSHKIFCVKAEFIKFSQVVL